MIEEIGVNELNIEPKDFQQSFFASQARYPAFVAAWATGKSLFGIMRALELSEEYPGNLGLIVRKEYCDLRDSTVRDYENYTGRKINKSEKEDTLSNGSVIMFRHAEELDTLKNINLGWFWIEQAEELETAEQFVFLMGRLRRSDVGFRTGFVTANQNGHNWVWRLWKEHEGKDKDYPLFEAKTYDNADVLPEDYIASLEKIKTILPVVYSRNVENNWDEEAAGDWIIPLKDIENAILRNFPSAITKRVVSVDPASGGGDEIVILAMEGTEIIDKDIFVRVGETKTMEVVGRAAVMHKKHKTSLIAVDEIGVGAGVRDRLVELGLKVLPVNSASRTDGLGNDIDPQYKNLRAKMWWDAGAKFREGKVQLRNCDDILKKQLSSVQYSVMDSSGKIQVEKKEKVKARLESQSPDRADAYVQGLYALEYATAFEGIENAADDYISYEEKFGQSEKKERIYA